MNFAVSYSKPAIVRFWIFSMNDQCLEMVRCLKKISYSLFFYLSVARYTYRFKFTTSKSKSKSKFKWTDEFDWTRHASRDGAFSRYGLCVLIFSFICFIGYSINCKVVHVRFCIRRGTNQGFHYISKISYLKTRTYPKNSDWNSY